MQRQFRDVVLLCCLQNQPQTSYISCKTEIPPERIPNNHEFSAGSKPLRTRLPSNLRPTTRECVHLVTRDKYGGHTIRFTIVEYHMLHTNFINDAYIARIWILDLCCCCDLDLDPMTFIYEFDPYSLEIYCMRKLKIRDRKMRDQWCQVWGTKNAVLENAGPGKCRTWNANNEFYIYTHE